MNEQELAAATGVPVERCAAFMRGARGVTTSDRPGQIERVIAWIETNPLRNAQTREVAGYMLSADQWRVIRAELRRIAEEGGAK